MPVKANNKADETSNDVSNDIKTISESDVELSPWTVKVRALQNQNSSLSIASLI